MKIAGVKIQGPNETVVVIARGVGKDIIFKCRAVLEFDDFEKLCPDPIPPLITKPNKASYHDIEDRDYKIEQLANSQRRINWMIVKSLEATEGLEFETVDRSKPETWKNIETELKEAGFSRPEINQVFEGVLEANGMSEEKLKEARARFFRGPQE